MYAQLQCMKFSAHLLTLPGFCNRGWNERQDALCPSCCLWTWEVLPYITHTELRKQTMWTEYFLQKIYLPLLYLFSELESRRHAHSLSLVIRLPVSKYTAYNLLLSWHHIFLLWIYKSDYYGMEASLVLKWRMFLLKLLQVVNWVIKYLRETRIFWSKQRVGSPKVVQFFHAFSFFSWAFKISLSATIPIIED